MLHSYIIKAWAIVWALRIPHTAVLLFHSSTVMELKIEQTELVVFKIIST